MAGRTAAWVVVKTPSGNYFAMPRGNYNRTSSYSYNFVSSHRTALKAKQVVNKLNTKRLVDVLKGAN